MSTIYIYCPGNVISGGVNSLHNLCSHLVKSGFQAGMVYHSVNPLIINHHQIQSYAVPVFEYPEDDPENLLIVSETEIAYLHRFPDIRKMVYWLGLNYFFSKPPYRWPFNYKLLRKAIRCRNYYGYSAGIHENLKRKLSWWAKNDPGLWGNGILHLSNSFYVAECLQKKGATRVYVLHNPVRNEYYTEHKSFYNKKRKIVFGQKTPRILIFLCRMLFNAQIVRLKHLPPETVKQHMLEAMVFAEFGYHSGRDRMPREAVLLGCIILTNTRGSAAFHQDIPIPSSYKIPDKLFLYPAIIKRIAHCLNNYENCFRDFRPYVIALEKEYKDFPESVKSVFQEVLKESK
jgi:hypothetical protein